MPRKARNKSQIKIAESSTNRLSSPNMAEVKRKRGVKARIAVVVVAKSWGDMLNRRGFKNLCGFCAFRTSSAVN